MKKILLMMMFLVVIFAIIGCSKTEDNKFGTYEFENKTSQTLSDVQDKISFYQEKVESLYLTDISYEETDF
ncbi:MAG: hypothetical protein K8Q99_01460 [Acholeplasmataceae bacterium]|nr:hypothetical protein [Acholeplasmataceae bacterium]